MKQISKLSPLKILLFSIALLLQSCAHLFLENCGEMEKEGFLLPQVSRIRSSYFRMKLANVPSAANRFLPTALMSSLTYADDCIDKYRNEEEKVCDVKISQADRERFEDKLHNMQWCEFTEKTWVPACEDETGLYFRIWTKEAETTVTVITAFRGTWGVKDWLQGNAHWFNTLFHINDQYSSARRRFKEVMDYFKRKHPNKKIIFYTTGHSLGGGLAQYILYSYPDDVLQAVAFDPSLVTGFWDQESNVQVKGCECKLEELNGEPRIYRVYEAGEILTHLRIFHKLFFLPHRHIQEVRFENNRSHSIVGLTKFLIDQTAKTQNSTYVVPWYKGEGVYSKTGESCTAEFRKAQETSCNEIVTEDQCNKCPP